MKSIYLIFLLIFILPITMISANENEDDLSDEEILEMFEDDEDSKDDILDKIDDPELDIEITKIEYIVNKAVSVKWIESFLLFKKGMKMKLKDLDRLVDETLFRLRRLKHFYIVKIIEKSSLKDIHQRKIIVEVSDGFWHGFNFRPINLTLIFKHLFKSGKNLGLTGGVTEQTIWFYDPSVLFSPFFYTFLVSHTTDLENTEQYIEDSTLISFTPGINLTYEISVNAILEWQLFTFPEEYFYYDNFTYNLSESEAESFGVDSPTSYLTFGLSNNYNFNRTEFGSIFGFEDEIQGKYIFDINNSDQSFWAVQNRAKFFLRPVPPLNIVIRGLGGYHTGTANPYQQYHLYDYDYFRGMPEVDYGDHIMAGNVDISLIDVLKVQFGMFLIDFQPFIYYDIGKLFQYNEDYNLDNMEMAAGGGIHVYFADPVGLYLTLGMKNRVDPDDWKVNILFSVTDYIY